MRKLFITFFICLSIQSITSATEYLYILNDKCINDLFLKAKLHFKNSEVIPIKDSRGIVLRLQFEDPIKEFNNMSISSYKKIEYFLAKLENPAIIEVHTAKFPLNNSSNLKNWEISTVIANRIETVSG